MGSDLKGEVSRKIAKDIETFGVIQVLKHPPTTNCNARQWKSLVSVILEWVLMTGAISLKHTLLW